MYSFYKASNQKILPQKMSFVILFKNHQGLENTKIILITKFSMGDGDGGDKSYYLNFLNRKSLDVVYWYMEEHRNKHILSSYKGSLQKRFKR